MSITSPRVLGHEGAGVVEDVSNPALDAHWAGKHVTILPRARCEKCASCLNGGGPLACDAPARFGIDRDGVFAEWVSVPPSSVIEVPKDLSLKHAAYVEPVAAALAVLNAGIKSSDRVLLYTGGGENRISELTRRVLAAANITNVVTNASDGDADVDVDVAIETVATNATLPALLKCVRRGGRILLKSRPFEPIALDVATAVEKEITIQAVRYGSFDQAVTWLANGKLVIDDLLGESFSLADHERAFAAARKEQSKPFFDLRSATK